MRIVYKRLFFSVFAIIPPSIVALNFTLPLPLHNMDQGHTLLTDVYLTMCLRDLSAL